MNRRQSMSRGLDSDPKFANQPIAGTAQTGGVKTVVVLVVIAACVLSCGLILLVPTSSINTTTVYRGF